jgi:uncharacterized coiled-coil protein SlyX
MAEISKQALKVDNNQSFPNNNNGAITPSILRAFNTNMIDSMVDELSYNVDSASWNQQIDALEQFTSSVVGINTGSLLVTASAVSNVITFTKGDTSTFNVTVADTTDLSQLNQATASLQTFTASANIRLNNLESTTASLLVETQNLELFSASALVSISNLNASSASQQVSINSLNAATSSYVTETESGSFLITASFDNGNRNLTFTKGDNTTFAVNIPDVSGSTGNFVTTASFNAYTQSNDQRVSSLEVNSASVNTSVTNLNSATASLFGSASLGLTTASVNVNIITFSKGDGTTFDINVVASGSVIPGTITGSAQITALGFVSSSVTASSLVTASAVGNTITFTKGDSSTFNVSVIATPIDTGSFATTASFNAYTQSNDQRVSSLETNSASVNISIAALNTFTASQSTASIVNSITELNSFSSSALVSISNLNASSASQQISIDNLNTNSASVNISVTNLNSATASLFASASLSLITASFDNGTRNLTFTKGDNQTFSVNIPDVSGSAGNFVTTSSFNAYTASVTQSIVTAMVTNVGSSYYQIDGIQAPKLSFVPGPTYRFDLSGIAGNHPFKFSTTPNGPTEYTTGVTSGSNFIQIEVGYDTTTPLYYYCTNHSGMGNEINVLGIEKLVTTASFNAYTASQSTGSLVTSITSLNTFTSSVVLLNANNRITGSQIMSGSLTITGSAFGNVVALSITSNTASMDLNLGNYFTLTLADTATTHISASNVQPGTSATLVITTGTNSSASLAPTMLQPSGSAYSATLGSSKKDVLSIVAVASGVPFVVSTKNMI